jgi:hypothetical protein
VPEANLKLQKDFSNIEVFIDLHGLRDKASKVNYGLRYNRQTASIKILNIRIFRGAEC